MRVIYPDLDTTSWVSINKSVISNTDVHRAVSGPHEIDHETEFAVPFLGGFPTNVSQELEQNIQKVDASGVPMYDDGASGTTDEYDGNGDPYPPLLEAATSNQRVFLEEFPSLFFANEIEEMSSESLVNHKWFDEDITVSPWNRRYDYCQYILGWYFDQFKWGSSQVGPSYPFTGGGRGTINPPFITRTSLIGFADPDSDPALGIRLIAPDIFGLDYYVQLTTSEDVDSSSWAWNAELQDADDAGQIQKITPNSHFDVMRAMLPAVTTPDDQISLVVRIELNGLVPEEQIRDIYIPYVILMLKTTGGTTIFESPRIW